MISLRKIVRFCFLHQSKIDWKLKNNFRDLEKFKFSDCFYCQKSLKLAEHKVVSAHKIMSVHSWSGKKETWKLFLSLHWNAKIGGKNKIWAMKNCIEVSTKTLGHRSVKWWIGKFLSFLYSRGNLLHTRKHLLKIYSFTSQNSSSNLTPSRLPCEYVRLFLTDLWKCRPCQ